MKTFSKSFLLISAVVALSAGFNNLRAQYQPPPPPDQMDQGAPSPVDQSAPPPGIDQSAPPPDDSGAPASADDQGAPPPDDASGSADFQTFYNDLSSQGSWVQTDNYGYVWQPDVQDPDWAPYTNGHWVYTDEGWAWVADESEPWGWATYHYGRWVNIDGEGWVWVPGYTWAPAWVSWRYGGGYCGWAPLPPDTFVGIDFGGIGFGFHIGDDCDRAYGIGPGYYHFVPAGYIGARNYRPYYVNRANNFTIINNTRNVTNIVVGSRGAAGRFGRVNAGGPSFATLNAQARTPLQRAQLTRSNRAGAAQLSGNRLAVFAPHVNAAAAGQTYRPRSVGARLSNVQVNRGTNISRPLAATARLRGTAPTAGQVAAARVAEARGGRAAGVATADTRPTKALAQPLTALRPHTEARTQASATPAPVKNAAVRTSATAENAFTGERDAASTTSQTPRERTEEADRAQAAGEEAKRRRTEEANRIQDATGQARRSQEDRAAVERTQVEHASAAQARQAEPQRQEVRQEVRQAAPVAPHPQAASQQHASPASHPAGNGGGGGKDDKKKDQP